MEELVSTFHIDWGLMVAQLANFGLVFLALYFIAAKPLSKLMKDRTEEITTGLENAEKAKKEIANAGIQREEIIREAKEGAKKIVAGSQADGKEIVKEARDRAIFERDEIVKQAKLDAEKEKKIAGDAVNREAGEMISESVRKMIEGYVAEGKGEEIIKGILSKKA